MRVKKISSIKTSAKRILGVSKKEGFRGKTTKGKTKSKIKVKVFNTLT